ncbi:amino acid ABC transporter substrate-binding protein [Bacillus sp. CGMCC 1.16541]|uniref:amino acid ABC transporter substrate-binding protein n=1 Tax=Bacillus sp. CGMCC 1.16541 TaxID=2185143 RepID=UPI000D72DD37|nr:amino acid ABC transporter substrate-binding protein [Bacillus sp. CGMCC 1.16541]
MKKLVVLMSILLTFAFVLTACGTSDSSNGGNESNKESAQSDLYAKVKEEGVLKVGTEGTYPPFTFHDESGKLTGFDVEIAEEVAKRLGVEVKFMETQWDGMFAGLDTKRFDMIANQVGIRPDREEKYDFSDPYIASAAVLIVAKDNEEITKFEDLKGKKAAQSLTSNYGDLAKSYEAELTGVEGFNQAMELITSKRVDGTINDKLSFLDYTKQRPNAPVKVVDEAEDAAESGLMFRKDSGKLVEEVNKALKEMQEDGTYKEISDKWFGEDVSPK